MTSKTITTEEAFQKALEQYLKIAESQRQWQAERVKENMGRTVNAGYWVSRPPFGYSPNSRTGIMRVNRKGRALRDIMKRFATSGSKEQFLSEMGSLLGSRYSRIRVAFSTVSNPIYRGQLAYEGKTYEGKHEPLISEAEHKTIIEKLLT